MEAFCNLNGRDTQAGMLPEVAVCGFRKLCDLPVLHKGTFKTSNTPSLEQLFEGFKSYLATFIQLKLIEAFHGQLIDLLIQCHAGQEVTDSLLDGEIRVLIKHLCALNASCSQKHHGSQYNRNNASYLNFYHECLLKCF